MDTRKQHFLLRAALTIQGQALTLYEEVHLLNHTLTARLWLS
jgi:hypothetical protein